MFEQIIGPETLEATQLRQALSDVADFAVLTSGGQSHPTFRPPHTRELAAFYHDNEAIVQEWTRTIETEVGSDPDGMARATAAFIDDPLQLNATLAMRRMDGRWDGVTDLEPQGDDVVRMLQAAGYHDAKLVSRASMQAKVSLSIVPGTTDEQDYIALRRNRLWIVGENEDLPQSDRRRILEVDKTSWFTLRIPTLAEVEASAAQKEVWLIIICTALLQDIRLDWLQLREDIGERRIGMHDLLDFLPPDFTAKEAGIMRTAIERAQQYGIPDNLIMTRLFDTEYLMRLWSPASRMYIENFIASSTQASTYPNRSLTTRASGLLAPAETIYYLSGRPALVGRSVPTICDKNGLMWPEMASKTAA